MQPADLFRLALSSLARHKIRTLLTLGGVFAGSFLLVVSVSLGRGVEVVTIDQFHKAGPVREISVFPSYQAPESSIPKDRLDVPGTMSEEKRERLRQSLVRQWPRRNPAATRLSAERLREIERLAHVESVVPVIHESGEATWQEKKPIRVLVAGANPDAEHLKDRLLAGRGLPESGRYVVVHEFLLYQWGLTRDEDVQQILGQTIRLEVRYRGPMSASVLGVLRSGAVLNTEENETLGRALDRVLGALQKLDLTESEQSVLRKALLGNTDSRPRIDTKVFSEEFTVVGVIREWSESDGKSGSTFLDWVARDTEIFMPVQTAAQKELFGGHPRLELTGFTRATVIVDDVENIKEVNQTIAKSGLQTFSLAEILDRVKKNILLLSIATAFLAAMALLVAAIGITNMMLMSVMERTHEIGLMKAVGARDRHIQFLFLFEGLLLGLVGGGLGVLAGWLASFPGDRIARGVVEETLESKLDQTLFVYPSWLLVGVPLFAVLVATLAAVYPARRAARINPIQALRNE